MLKKMIEKKRIQDTHKFLDNIEPNIKHILSIDDIDIANNYMFEKIRTSHSANDVIQNYRLRVKENKSSVNPYCIDISILVHMLTRSKNYIEKKYNINLDDFTNDDLKKILSEHKKNDSLLAKYINENFKGEKYTEIEALYLVIKMRYLEVYLHFLTETDLIHQ